MGPMQLPRLAAAMHSPTPCESPEEAGHCIASYEVIVFRCTSALYIIFTKAWRLAGSVLATTTIEYYNYSGPNVVSESPPALPKSPTAGRRFSL